jgi:hypothetical protein
MLKLIEGLVLSERQGVKGSPEVGDPFLVLFSVLFLVLGPAVGPFHQAFI